MNRFDSILTTIRIWENYQGLTRIFIHFVFKPVFRWIFPSESLWTKLDILEREKLIIARKKNLRKTEKEKQERKRLDNIRKQRKLKMRKGKGKKRRRENGIKIILRQSIKGINPGGVTVFLALRDSLSQNFHSHSLSLSLSLSQ